MSEGSLPKRSGMLRVPAGLLMAIKASFSKMISGCVTWIGCQIFGFFGVWGGVGIGALGSCGFGADASLAGAAGLAASGRVGLGSGGFGVNVF